MKMGADRLIATQEDKDWAKNNTSSLDLLINTVYAPNMPLEEYLGLLDIQGTYIQVGAPEDKIGPITAFALIFKRVKMGGRRGAGLTGRWGRSL